MRKFPRNPCCLLAGLILAACASGASATTLTISFVGGGEDSWQYEEHSIFDYMTGTQILYENTGTVYDPTLSGSMSFLVNSIYYTDSYPVNGIALAGDSMPWLASVSHFSGALFSQSASIDSSVAANYYSYSNSLDARAGSYGSGSTITLDQQRVWISDMIIDSLGRPLAWTENRLDNHAYFYGDVTLGWVDGQELPVSLGVGQGWISQSFSRATYTYGYDETGNYRTRTYDSFYQASQTAIQSAPMPVPAAAWLFGSGMLGLIGAARRKAA